MRTNQQNQTRIKIRNDFMPSDIKKIVNSINDFTNKEYNFSFIFRFPISEFNKEIEICINEDIDKYRWDEKFLSFVSNRQNKYIENLENSGYKVNSPIEMNLQWRMVIGLGATHPQETSMTLHHIYGIPYIPGSAIKGVTRHYRIWKIFEEIFNEPTKEDLEQIKCLEKILENADLTNKDEAKRNDKLDEENFKEKFKAKSKKDNKPILPSKKLLNDFLKIKQKKIIEFQKIFGTQKNKGGVIFFDSYPVGNINLKLDVMTPHYGPYYSKGNPPADYHKPKPIKFLTVEETKFRFYLASKKDDLLNKSKNWIQESLQNYGIGAKTAIGYGYFK